MRTFLIAAAAVLALGACTPLTARAPLFTVADQTTPPPLTEGVWALIEDDCTRAMAAQPTPPAACNTITVHRDTDRAWLISGADRDQAGQERTVNFRMIVVPAVATATPEAYAPLYLAEFPGDAVGAHARPGGPNYVVIAPIGPLPAREVAVIAIDCVAILREGPIDGVAEQRDGYGALTGCVADNQAAVREAARRAIIEDLGNIDNGRAVFVHP